MKGLVVLLSFLMVGVACGTRGDRWSRHLESEGPIVIDGRIVWLDRTLGSIVGVDPRSSDGPACLPSVGQPRGLAAAGSDALVVGTEGGADWLDRIPLSGGAPARIALPTAFDRIFVSPGGSRAVLLHDPAAAPRPGGPSARNLNELAVVDLAGRRAERIVLQTSAVAPSGVLFDAAGSLAAVLFDRAVALVDLRPPFHHVQVPLRLPTGEPLRLRQAILDPAGALLFLRVAELDEVLAISIAEGPSASVNFLGPEGGGSLRAIARPSGDGMERRIAALYDGRAVLLDADGDSSRELSVALDGTPSVLSDLGDGLLLLHGEAGQGSASSYVAAWDPGSGRLAQDRLEGAIVAPPRVAAGSAWFAHAASASAAALSVVTVERGELRLRLRLRPIGLAGVPTSTAIEPASGRLYVGIEVAREGSGAAPRAPSDDDFSGTTGALVSIGADDLSIDGLTLDETIDAVGVVGDFVYAIHPDDLGDLTVVPRDALNRGSAVRYEGVVATGLMGCSR